MNAHQNAPGQNSAEDAAIPPPASGTLALSAAFLAQMVGSSGEELLRRLQEDQRQRWRRGERFYAEYYREQMPSLNEDDEAFLNLVCSELFLRQELGETPDLDEYRRRLPEHAEALRQMLDRYYNQGNGQRDSVVELGDGTLPPQKNDAPVGDTLPPLPVAVIAKTPPAAKGAVSVPGYEILYVLARGGMGVVYKARHLKLKRIVALKMILSGGHASPAQLQRFVTEAEAVAALQHPNIVQIFETGEHHGLPYFSLEYVDGGSLAARVKENPLPAKEAAQIVEHLARGMDYAHKRGVVHRDLKPDNVLLTGDGVPKLTDFGLAKRVKDESGLTHTGAIMGTPSYMAPEQASGDTAAIGPSADVYGLGAILYRLVTGRPPFQAANVHDTLTQVRQDEPVPPAQLQSKTPRDLETIILKCLRKEPAKRYVSAADLADDLRRFLDNRPIVARPTGRVERSVKWVQRNPWVTALACATIVVALAGGSGILLKYEDAQEQTKIAKDNESKANTALVEKNEALKKVETALDEKGQALLASEKANHEERRQAYELGISYAEREWYAGRRERALQLLTSTPEEFRGWEHGFLEGLDNSHMAVLPNAAGGDPDGKFSFYVSVTSPAGDQKRQITFQVKENQTGKIIHDLTRPLHRIWNLNVAFRPDGGAVAYSQDDAKDFQKQGTIYVWDLERKEEIATFTGHRAAAYYLRFTADKRWLLTGDLDGGVAVWDLQQKRPAGFYMGQRQSLLAGNKVAGAGITPDGRFAASVTYKSAVHLWDVATGKPLGALGEPGLNSECLDVSPDGRFIAAAGKGGIVRVWECASGKELWALHGHTGTISQLCFSPDGTRLASRSDDGAFRIWSLLTGKTVNSYFGIPALGSYFGGAYLSMPMRFSPNGGRLIVGNQMFDVSRPQEFRVLRHNSKVVFGSDIHPLVFSPDGERMLTHRCGEAAKVWDLNTGRCLLQVPSPDLIYPPYVKASPDGTSFVVRQMTNPDKVFIWDIPTAKSRAALEGLDSTVVAHGFAFSPDSRELIGLSFPTTPDASRKPRLFLWDARSGKIKWELNHPIPLPSGAAPSGAHAWSDDGKRIAIVLATDWSSPRKIGDPGIIVVDAANGNVLSQQAWRGHKYHRVAFAEGSNRLVVRESEGLINGVRKTGHVFLWGPDSPGEPIDLGEDHRVAFAPQKAGPVTFTSRKIQIPSPSNPKSFTESYELLFHDTASGKLLHSQEAPIAYFPLLTPDHSRYFHLEKGPQAKLTWRDVHTGEVNRVICARAAGDQFSVIYSSDHMRFLVKSAEGWLLGKLNDAATITLADSVTLSNQLVFTEDGRRIIGLTSESAVRADRGMDDGTTVLRIWDAATGHLLLKLNTGITTNDLERRLEIRGSRLFLVERNRTSVWDSQAALPAHRVGLTETDQRAWHEEQCALCYSAGEWAGCLFHLDWLNAGAVPSPKAIFWRAHLLGGLQRWKEADKEFDAAIAAGNLGPRIWYEAALVKLALGDTSGYRHLCQLTSKLAPGELFSNGSELWIHGLGREAAGRNAIETDLDKSLGLHAVTRHSIKGIRHFRDGSMIAAVKALEETERLRNRGIDQLPNMLEIIKGFAELTGAKLNTAQIQFNPGNRASIRYVLAMCCHNLGQMEKANFWLKRALEAHEVELKTGPPSDWPVRLEMNMLRSEAEEYLKRPSPREWLPEPQRRVARRPVPSEFQGGWQLMSLEIDGKVVEWKNGPRFFINDGALRYGGGAAAKIVVYDEKPSPTEFTFPDLIGDYEGIWKIDNGNLLVCLNAAQDVAWPSDFATKDQVNRRLLVFKRVDAKEEPGANGANGFAGVELNLAGKDITVKSVVPNGPAQKAGLLFFDTILQIGAEVPTDILSAAQAFRKLEPGKEATIKVRRFGKEQEVKLKPGVLPLPVLLQLR